MGACVAVLRAAAAAASQQPPPTPGAPALAGLTAGSRQASSVEGHLSAGAAGATVEDDGSDLDTDLDISNLREQLAASGMH